MRSARGFTLMEGVAALALVACTILVASGVALRHRAVARRFDEHASALSLVSSRLSEAVASLDRSPAPTRLAYVAGESSGLGEGRGLVIVEPWGSGVVRVRSELSWRRGVVARETLVAVRP